MTNDNENNRFTELEHDNIALMERLFKEVWNERRTETIDELKYFCKMLHENYMFARN